MAAATFVPRQAFADDFPARPVHLLVGFPAGGVTDIIGRILAERLSARFGQSFIVENRGGAGGNLATEAVARAPPDGYTLLLTSGSNAYNTALYDNLSFDFVRDIAPVASVARVAGVMEVNPAIPAHSVPEFVAYAKAHPGKMNMATAGVGSGPHLYGELFKIMAGVDLITVNYRGSGPALPELLAGHVQVMFDVVVSSIGYIRAGQLRPLGVTTALRTKVLPDVPPIGNFLPGYETNGWIGIGAPAATPAKVIEKLNGEINTALADPKFTARLAELGAEPFSNSPAQFKQFVIDFTNKWRNIIRAARIKLD